MSCNNARSLALGNSSVRRFADPAPVASALAGVLLFTSHLALAQDAEEPVGAADDPASRESADPQQAPEDEPAAIESTPRATEEAELDEGPATAPPQTPPPAEPKAGDQPLAPYTRTPEPLLPLRNIEVGPMAGVAWRRSASARASYEPGPAIGASVRINLVRWLGVRGYVLHSWHAVNGAPEDFGVDADSLDQPALGVTLMAARLEPSYWLGDRARVFAALGAGWARVKADALTTRGATEVELGTRYGATTEIGGGIGGSYDVVAHWLTLSASVSAAATTNTIGEAFAPRQAFLPSGETVPVEGLPEFAGSFAAWLGLELLL